SAGCCTVARPCNQALPLIERDRGSGHGQKFPLAQSAGDRAFFVLQHLSPTCGVSYNKAHTPGNPTLRKPSRANSYYVNVSTPEAVFEELKRLGRRTEMELLTQSDEKLEAVLLERNEPLINLGLAC